MVAPKGSLTAAQYEIMEIVWQQGKAGMTVAEIWKELGELRSVSRTTVLNQVDRLEKRGWLLRKSGEGVARYRPGISQEKAKARLAGEFVNDFFGGSASQLVSSLLGGKDVKNADIDQLKKLIQEAAKQSGESKK